MKLHNQSINRSTSNHKLASHYITPRKYSPSPSKGINLTIIKSHKNITLDTTDKTITPTPSYKNLYTINHINK